MTMRSGFPAVLLLATCACRKEHIEAEHDAAAVAVVSASAKAVAPEAPAPSASATTVASAAASASAAPPARIPCGTKTCAATQFCVRESRGQGIAPPPGQNPVVGISYECWNSLPAQGGGMSCGPVGKNREVSCVALGPAAPPHGPF